MFFLRSPKRLRRADWEYRAHKHIRKAYKHTDVQTELFGDRFHAPLHQPVQRINIKLFEGQLAYTLPQAQAASLEAQDESFKPLRGQQEDGAAAKDGESEEGFLAEAMLHNLRSGEQRARVD